MTGSGSRRFSTPALGAPAEVKRGAMMLADGADIPAGDELLFATPAVTKVERPDGSIIVCTKNLKSEHSGDGVRPGWRVN
jgi:hypothetical protein